MKIGYLGAGTWGFCLASLLASKGFECVVWARDKDLVKTLQETKEHPDLPGHIAKGDIRFTNNLEEALLGIDLLVESVTSAGIRPVFQQVKNIGIPYCPIVLTSKGIEQNTELLLSDVIVEILGTDYARLIGCLSGPSHAEEVVQSLPTSVVAASHDSEVAHTIRDAFVTHTFRVYPNTDLSGVQFGGAMKNIMAIACGISDGLGFGDNTKAALMTRGLHEIRKLSVTKGCRPETLNGLAGMGDLCVTCLSTHSRNYRFGRLIAEGCSAADAKKRIGVAVEGMYTCVSARQLGMHHRIDLPITDAVYQILYENMLPSKAVKELLTRSIKEEHL
ncbi:MAG: NAD(P)-dependent glycerol-3-phosphate dehydrogenase [Chlamydiales bacterium]|nr:NAD(P)-dependent glycerol-3-phosphate dehydrogenase [Chlamydiales bacterium]